MGNLVSEYKNSPYNIPQNYDLRMNKDGFFSCFERVLSKKYRRRTVLLPLSVFAKSQKNISPARRLRRWDIHGAGSLWTRPCVGSCPKHQLNGTRRRIDCFWPSPVYPRTRGRIKVRVSMRLSPRRFRKASASASNHGCSSHEGAWASQPRMTLLPTTAASSQKMGLG